MRRFFMMALCLILTLGSARAALCVRMDESVALIEDNGREIVAPGVYQDMVSLDNELFAARMDSGWALMDEAGMLLSPALYDELRPAGDCILARRDGLWGLLGTDGREISSFIYGQIVPTGEGKYWAETGSNNDMESDEMCILDEKGDEIRTGVYVRQTGTVKENALLPVLLPGTGKWAYMDADGNLVLPARFDYAGPFLSGCAAVVIGGRYGAVNLEGEEICEADYDFMAVSPAGFLLAVRDREGAWVLDLKGRELAAYEGENLFAALAGEGYIIGDETALSVYDAAGRLVYQAAPEAAVSEGVNGQLILSEGMWGEKCVSILGTEEKYQNLYPLGTVSGEAVYASMEANAARYVNDLLGEIQISVDMDTARYGLVDGSGKALLPCVYAYMDALADDRLLVYLEDGWQVIDAKGQVYWAHQEN